MLVEKKKKEKKRNCGVSNVDNHELNKADQEPVEEYNTITAEDPVFVLCGYKEFFIWAGGGSGRTE